MNFEIFASFLRKSIYCHKVIWGCPQSKSMQILKASAKEDNRFLRKVTDISLQEATAVVKNPSANAGGIGHSGSVPGSGRSPGEGNGNPIQYSCLENPMDRRVWWATVDGSQRVGHDWSNTHTHTYTHTIVTQVEGKFTEATRGIIFANRISHGN